VLSLVTEVATRALKACWFQKWFVSRRLRPEAMAGLVHQKLTGMADRPIHEDLLNSSVPDMINAWYGSYLLPMASPEGAPTHPSYAAGHATVAGACVTILKAWFDEGTVIPNPVVSNADGTALVPYDGPPLTVGNELNKLAANVAIGRNAQGYHYRSDYWESLKLGEEVAIGVLRDQRITYNETGFWTLPSSTARASSFRPNDEPFVFDYPLLREGVGTSRPRRAWTFEPKTYRSSPILNVVGTPIV
jgi:hypothetical protein